MNKYEWIGLAAFIAITLWLMAKASAVARRARSSRPPWWTIAWLVIAISGIVVYAAIGNK